MTEGPLHFECDARKRKLISSLSNLLSQWNDKKLHIDLNEKYFAYIDKEPKSIKKISLAVVDCNIDRHISDFRGDFQRRKEHYI